MWLSCSAVTLETNGRQRAISPKDKVRNICIIMKKERSPANAGAKQGPFHGKRDPALRYQAEQTLRPIFPPWHKHRPAPNEPRRAEAALSKVIRFLFQPLHNA